MTRSTRRRFILLRNYLGFWMGMVISIPFAMTRKTHRVS